MQGNWWSNRLVLARCLLPPSLNLHPLDLLARMSPLAFIQCVIYAQLTGELDRLRQLSTLGPHLPSVPDEPSYLSPLNGTQAWNTTLYEGCADFSPHTQNGLANSQLLILLVNGCIAFGLNVISFTANGKVGSLSMTVAGKFPYLLLPRILIPCVLQANVKQVLTILLAVSLFGLNITFTNAVGISITLGGGACYAWVEYTSKKIPRTTSRERTT